MVQDIMASLSAILLGSRAARALILYAAREALVLGVVFSSGLLRVQQLEYQLLAGVGDLLENSIAIKGPPRRGQAESANHRLLPVALLLLMIFTVLVIRIVVLCVSYVYSYCLFYSSSSSCCCSRRGRRRRISNRISISIILYYHYH